VTIRVLLILVFAHGPTFVGRHQGKGYKPLGKTAVRALIPTAPLAPSYRYTYIKDRPLIRPLSGVNYRAIRALSIPCTDSPCADLSRIGRIALSDNRPIS
jgi:hypothetical protein